MEACDRDGLPNLRLVPSWLTGGGAGMVPVKWLWLYSMIDRPSPAGHTGRAPVS